MKKMVLIVLLFVSFIIPLVTAEISISQPNKIYNAGDSFSVNIIVTPNVQKNDFLISKIGCEEKEVEVFKSPYSLKAGQRKEIPLSFGLDKFLVGDLKGICFISASFGSESVKSDTFELNRKINVTINSVNNSFIPGQKVILSGKLSKLNGGVPNSNVSLNTGELGVSLSGFFDKGSFSFEFDIPEKAKAKEYEINIDVEELDGLGEIINAGDARLIIIVNQVPERVDVALSGIKISPENGLTYIPVIYDQTEDAFKGNIQISIYDPKNKLFSKEDVKSGESKTISFNSTAIPGNWKIKMQYGDLKSEKSFEIENFEKILFSLEADSFLATNLGNIPYNKQIEVVIGEVSQFLNLELNVEETKKFKLFAQDGNYEIKVNDGGEEHFLGNAALTGKAINIKETGLLSGGFGKIIAWIILIIIFVSLGIYYSTKMKKRRKEDLISSKIGKPNPQFKEGNRLNSVLITLKIKNLDEIRNNPGTAVDTLRNVLSLIKQARGKVKMEGNFWSVAFAEPEKASDFQFRIVKIAKEMETMLNGHNRKYSQKIDFGLGVSLGELVFSSDNFISIDNLIISGKKIAEQAKNEILLSDKIHMKTLTNVKVSKDGDYWKVTRLVERNSGPEFRGFVKKND